MMTPKTTSNLHSVKIDYNGANTATNSSLLSASVDLDLSTDSRIIGAANGAGMRIDKFLASSMPEFSRSRIQKWFDLGVIKINDEPVTQKLKLSGIEIIEVEPQPHEADQAFEPDPMDIDVVLESDDYLIVNKPAGLVVHPGNGHWRNTLLNGLLYRDKLFSNLPRAGIVHRLDKDTSGLMVVAKTETCRLALIDALSRHDVARNYLALAWGQLPERFTVNQPIGRDAAVKVRMAVSANGKPAVTHFEKVADGILSGKPVSLMKVALQTGRTHQIRVHCHHIGHGLVGDPVYFTPVHLKHSQTLSFERQALHAWRLQFNWQAREVKADRALPNDLINLLSKAGIAYDAALE